MERCPNCGSEVVQAINIHGDLKLFYFACGAVISVPGEDKHIQIMECSNE